MRTSLGVQPSHEPTQILVVAEGCPTFRSGSIWSRFRFLLHLSECPAGFLGGGFGSLLAQEELRLFSTLIRFQNGILSTTFERVSQKSPRGIMSICAADTLAPVSACLAGETSQVQHKEHQEAQRRTKRLPQRILLNVAAASRMKALRGGFGLVGSDGVVDSHRAEFRVPVLSNCLSR